MSGRLVRPLAVLTAAVTAACVLMLSVAPAPACPFCNSQGTTLTGEVNQANMVLFGTAKNPVLDPNGFNQGTTELHIEAVLKKHEILGDQKMVVLPKYIPPADKGTKWLVFCDVFKGKVDPYRGIPVKAGQDIVKYLTGALDVKGKAVSARLKFFFDYLDSADLEISNDAYKEFANADYKDYRDLAKGLPADKIVKWLQDPNTPSFRYGLYASMLGHCGNEKHAAILRKMLDDPDKRLTTGVDGLLAGYVMLKPAEGWEYVLKDGSKEFVVRYAALRASRFFWEFRPDVVDKKKIVDAVCLLLDQGDIADMAIDDLRKWGRSDMADRVLALWRKESHDVPIVKRTIIKFALSFPKDAKAAAFVEEQRKKSNEMAEMVKDVEELLKLENTPPPVAAKSGTNQATAGTTTQR